MNLETGMVLERNIGPDSEMIRKGFENFLLAMDKMGIRLTDEEKKEAFLAIEKYQAQIEKNPASHEEAMKYLLNIFKKHGNDFVMTLIIKTIDKPGKNGDLFLEKTDER